MRESASERESESERENEEHTWIKKTKKIRFIKMEKKELINKTPYQDEEKWTCI